MDDSPGRQMNGATLSRPAASEKGPIKELGVTKLAGQQMLFVRSH